MNEIVELAFKLLFRIVAQFVINVAAQIAVSLTYLYLRRTGDFLVELVTLDYFRDHSDVEIEDKPLHPVPGWAAALLGLVFWCGFATTAYLFWSWFASP